MQSDCSEETCRARQGFTMVELLVVLVVIAVLASLLMSALGRSKSTARNVSCVAKMRTLGTGILLYSVENEGEFPRSLHSASAYGKQPWAQAILPYLGGGSDVSEGAWTAAFEKFYRCPEDKARGVTGYSYALNVHFELNPETDDYAGGPATWRTTSSVPEPASTILLAEPRLVLFADHVMCHMWSSQKAARNALDYARHGRTANYLFVDGHVKGLTLDEVFNPAKGIDRLNPSRAGTTGVPF